jgi:serine protease AprX
VTPDAAVRFLAADSTSRGEPVPARDRRALARVAQAIGATDAYRAGYTGKGVDVAVIDTGVAPVEGLTSGNVVDGPDLSFDSQSPDLAHLDAFGHGTHIASLIAGRDKAAPPASYAAPDAPWHGIAPDARIISVKVGAADGATDVSQVIAAVDWVVAHRDDGDVRIRVLNLSFGTDGMQSPDVDPLAFAVENATRHGITVVAAAGNGGAATTRLANPAQDPYVIAVGAADTRGTATVKDDVVAPFSNGGTVTRHADFVAPGVALSGLRTPGSVIDELHPATVEGDRFLRGSGTSQAAAITSGAVALLLQRYPDLTPDQVKRQLMRTATPLPGASAHTRGSGLLDVAEAVARPVTRAAQPAAHRGTGTGSLEGARGTAHVSDGESELTGEQDIFGVAWNPGVWAPLSERGEAWQGGQWNGSEWTGGSWEAVGWTGKTWVGKTWVGKTWVGKTWVGKTWVGKTWVGKTWVGKTWVGKTWVGKTWVGKTWVGDGWVGDGWVGKTWVGKTWVGKTWVGKTWVTESYS